MSEPTQKGAIMPRPKSSLLINEPPLQALPSLAKAIGLTGAVILQQIHYWLQASNHVQEDRPWIFNSYKEWSEQFTWLTANAIKKQILSLEKSGVLISRQFSKESGDLRKWYTIDYQVLEDMVPNLSYGGPKVAAAGRKVSGDGAKSGRSTSYKTTQKTPSSKGDASRKRAAPVPDTRIGEVFDAVLKHLGNPEIDPIPNHGKEATFIKRMLTRGYSVDQIVAFWKKKSAARGGVYVSMVYVNEDIGKEGQQGALLPTEDELAREAESKGLT